MTAPATEHIVFSHANGFPAQTYRVHFDAWRAAGFGVSAIARYAHEPRYAAHQPNWQGLKQQLLDHIDALPTVDEQARPVRVWLAGHSLGGLLSLMALLERPHLVHGAVLLDSPIITGWRAWTVNLGKRTGLMGRFSPGAIARRRRDEWPSRDAVAAHFAAKPAFARWDARVLADYVDCGFEAHADGVRLAVARDTETLIYNHLPHTLGRLLCRQRQHAPVALLAGRDSAEMRLGGIARSKALAGSRFVWMPGDHLFPMQQPEATAAEVVRQLRGMGASPVGAPAPP